MEYLHTFNSLNESKSGYDKNMGKHGRGQNSHGLLMRPTKKDPRYLEKTPDNKFYIVKVWDGKSKLA